MKWIINRARLFAEVIRNGISVPVKIRFRLNVA